MSQERDYLRGLNSDQTKRLELVRAGLPIPAALEAKKNPGNKSYYPPLPKTREWKGKDPRRVHKEDAEWHDQTECGDFWRRGVGVDAPDRLRHTKNWTEVTCRKCLTYK